MKKCILFILSFFVIIAVDAQPWMENLPTEKSSSSYTFYDYQKAFNTYWEPYQVKRGYFTDKEGVVRKAPGWKQFKRWEYFWKSRVDAQTGAFNSTDINAIYKEEKSKSAFKNSGELWVSLGPSHSEGGYAGIGRVNALAFNPSDSNMIWAGTASGGLWVTADGGKNWSVLNDDMQSLGVSDIIIPSNFATSQTIYLATGDRDAYDTRSIGLLKSVDAGANWESMNLDFTTDQGAIINRVLLDPVGNINMIAAGNFGVYKSFYSKFKKEQGLAWKQVSSLVFIDIKQKPGNFDVLYGSTKSGGIYVSTDNGETWTQSLAVDGGRRVELAVSPAAPGCVYAVVANGDHGLSGIYKSIDDGANFDLVYDGSNDGANLLGWDFGTDDGGQGWYDLTIAVSPTDTSKIIIGGVNAWMSVNGGLDFDMVNHWYGGFGSPAVHADKHFMGFQPLTGKFFEGNDGGIYQTHDFENWEDISNGIVHSQIYRLGTSATDPFETIVGLQDNGTKLNNESSWEDVTGGDGTECIIDYTNKNIQYGAYVNGEIYRTTNRWLSTTKISSKIPGDLEGAWVTPYIINPIDPKVLYIGYEEVWRTKNSGVSFEQISSFQGANLEAMAIAPSDTATLYVSTSSKLFRTNDGGLTWIDVTGNLPMGSGYINYLAVKHDDPNTVWRAMSGYSPNGVYQSSDGGLTWVNIAEGLPEIPCNTIVQNKLNTNEVELYAGTDVGVYLKLGDSPWTLFSTGLPNVVVSELEIYYDPVDPSQSKLRAATYGRGLWETTIYQSSIGTGIAPLINLADAIYPNPSSGKFKIDFTAFDGKEIELEVHSLSGKLIYKKTLFNASNTIDLKDYANGIYVLQVKKGNRWYGQNIVIRK
ncbi:MAG: T9SS type A sorting domain-containing protein [Bacteroidales bacterium]|nr:T9SS type A sorting domain-containing protein [Bacteroidales bacterium]